METSTAVQDEPFVTTVLCDVPRSENDVYRISLKECKRGRYIDLRIFFRNPEDASLFLPTLKGVCFREMLREDVIAGLIMARQAPDVERQEGEEFRCVKICEIPLSVTERLRISKGAGARNTFVDVRWFLQKDGVFVPSKRRGVAILPSSIDEVILGLMRTEPERSA